MSKKKASIDFAQPVLDYDGNPQKEEDSHGNPTEKDLTLGKAIHRFFGQDNGDDPLKFDSWARAAYKQEVLELDESDTQKMYDFIKTHKVLSASFRAFVMRIIKP